MSNERPMDLRVQKTREAIKKAFKEMICQMDSNEITIKELAERAQINRKTFYLHFGSIEALYSEVLQTVAQGYSKEMAELPVPVDMSDGTRKFFTYLSNQGDYVERLVCNLSYRDFCNKLFNTTLSQNRKRHNPYSSYSEEEQKIINVFLSSSSLDIYRQWVTSGKQMDLEDVIKLTSTLICTGIYSITKKEK